MKNKNQLIASAFGLMMVMSLLFVSAVALADSGSNVSAPGAPYIEPAVSSVTANLTGTYNNTGTVSVHWAVTNGSEPWSAIWNHTRLVNVTGNWQEPTWANASTSNVRTLSGLADGVYILNVRAFFYNSSVGAFQNTTESTCTFTVDTVEPTIAITTPANGGRYNSTNFTAVFSASNGSTGSSLATFTGALTNVTGTGTGTTVNLAVSATSAPITKFYDWDNLTVGEWSLMMTAVDGAGNSKIAYSNFTVGPYVVITAPGAGVNVLNFTATWTPHLMPGVAIENYTAYLYNVTDSKAAGLAANVSIYHQIWITNITAGNALLVNGNIYKLFVNVTDVEANKWSNNVTFIVDDIAPTVSWVSPENATFTNNASAAIRWIADGTGSSIQGSVVTIYNMTTADSKSISIIGSTNTSSLNNFWGVPLVNGLYKLRVVVTDFTGNTAQNMTNVTVDVTNPTVVISAPLNGTYLANNNFVAEWIANGTGSAIASSNVTIYGTVNKSMEIVGTSNTTNMTNVWGSALPDGVYRMTVKVFDSAGNSAMAETNFTVDTAPPTIAISAPANGAMLNNGTVTFIWVAFDSGSGLNYYSYTLNGTWIITTDQNVTITLPEGNYSFSVRAYDKAGNPSATSTRTFMVDLTAPTLNITAPVNGELFGVAHVLVSWTANDTMSGIAEYSVNINGTWIVIPSTNNSYLFEGLSDGSHEVLVKATDNAGNFVVKNVTFTVDLDAPWVTITQPVAGLHTNVDDVRMNWTVMDNITGIAYIHVWIDDEAFINLTNSTENVTYMFEGVTQGPHVLHVQVWDLAGNSQAKTVSVVVDLTAPEIVFLNPHQQSELISETSINASWAVTDSLSPIVKIEVAIDAGFYMDVGLNTSQVFADLAVGQHQIFVRAWDSAGNNGTNHIAFVVDLTAPTVVAHTPTPASGAIVLPDQVIKVNFSKAMNQSSVAFTGITGTKTWNAAGTEVTLTHAALTYATTYTVVVSGKDLAGNVLTGANKTFSFTTVTLVSGTINDDKGNPIANATVKLTQGTTVVEGLTDVNGHFALVVNGGVYNLTVSKAGFQDLVQNDKTFGVGQTNTLGAMAMTPNADYTLLIVGVIVVLAIVLVALFLMRRQKIIIKK